MRDTKRSELNGPTVCLYTVLETARKTISMTYSTINMYSLAHVYNLTLEITFKPFYTLYVLIHGPATARETISMIYSTIKMYSLFSLNPTMLCVRFVWGTKTSKWQTSFVCYGGKNISLCSFSSVL